MPKLYFRHGVMSASKTADLLMQAYNMNVKGKAVLVLKPSVDTRSTQLLSRVGISRHCDIIVRPDTNLLLLINTTTAPGATTQPNNHNEADGGPQPVLLSAIFVDEVQFLEPCQIDQLRQLARQVNVFCYGLRTDYRCRLFPASARLMELADTIEELSASCEFCEQKAIVNAKFINDIVQRDGNDTVDIGGEDKYISMCWSCWNLTGAFESLTAFKTMVTAKKTRENQRC